MVNLSDRRSITETISAISDPRETAVVLAARAVLRALPLIVDEYDIKKSKGALEFPFKVFSAANITWAVARYPELRGQQRAQVRRIKIFEYGAVSTAISFALAATDRAAGAASFAAGPAAADAASGAIEATRRAFLNDLVAADAALEHDFDCLTNGTLLPRELAGQPLWLGATPNLIPDLFTIAKEELYRILSKRPTWDVWIDWYEARLLGKSSNEKAEIDRIAIAARYPTIGIRYINDEIKDRVDAVSSWSEKLETLKQTRLGAKFVQQGNRLTIDPRGDESDVVVSHDTVMLQLHEGIKRRAREFSEIAKRVDNLIGWQGLGAAAVQFREAVECATEDVPDRIGLVYDSTISLGSFLDLDARLRKSSDRTNADPLDLEVQRAFIDLIRAAAPWLRRFPTARMLDDEAGAFLSRTEHFEAAARIVQIAESTSVILRQDSELLTAVVDAGRRGAFQGEKASARSIWSSKNLVTALAVIFSFETGLINNKAAEQSIIAQNGARLYLSAETEILRLFEDAPEDIRQAMAALIDDLRRQMGGSPTNLPEKPKERFDSLRRLKEGESEGEN